jgi:hypothetical protein
MAAPSKLLRRTPSRQAECPDDLYDYANLPPQGTSLSRSSPASKHFQGELGFPWPFAGRPPKDDFSTWIVTDDVDVFEAWFGDVFDNLFGPCR